jgi:hypothetical protein
LNDLFPPAGFANEIGAEFDLGTDEIQTELASFSATRACPYAKTDSQEHFEISLHA